MVSAKKGRTHFGENRDSLDSQAGDSASTALRPTAGFRGALGRHLQNALIWMVKKG